jgi:hypothetical protein
MAEGEFGGGVEFGHGFVERRKVKERIVAEALVATWGGEDFAFYGAVGGGENFAVSGCGENATIAGGVRACDAGEGLLEAEVVALVRCAGEREVAVVGVAGGADAGGSVESIDLEAGVVGEDDLSGRVLGVVQGLEAGVAFKGGLVFFGGGDLVEAGQGSERDEARGCGEVSQLAGVGGGDVERHGFLMIVV